MKRRKKAPIKKKKNCGRDTARGTWMEAKSGIFVFPSRNLPASLAQGFSVLSFFRQRRSAALPRSDSAFFSSVSTL